MEAAQQPNTRENAPEAAPDLSAVPDGFAAHAAQADRALELDGVHAELERMTVEAYNVSNEVAEIDHAPARDGHAATADGSTGEGSTAPTQLLPVADDAERPRPADLGASTAGRAGPAPTGGPLYEQLFAELDEGTRTLLRRRNRARRSKNRGYLVQRVLWVSDVLMLGAAWIAAALVTNVIDSSSLLSTLAVFAALQPIWFLLARSYGLYDADVQQTNNTTVDDATGVFHLVLVGAVLMYVGARLVGVAATPETVGLFWALALPGVGLARAAARAVMRRRPTYTQNTVIVGAGTVGQLVAAKLARDASGINVIGFVDTNPRPLAPQLAGARFLGTLESLPTLVRLLDVERVIVAFSSDTTEELLTFVRRLDDVGVQVDIVPRLFEVVGPRAQLHTVAGLPLVGLPPLRLSSSAMFAKRMVDIVASTVLLVAFAPVLAAIALSIKRASPGPVFYRSSRIGKNGRRFDLLKFRTMRSEYCRGSKYGGADAEAAFRALMRDSRAREEFERSHKLSDDPRVTPVGDFLRRTSLDELPQLFNVLKGDLALVGPRPITTEEYDELIEGRQLDTTAPAGVPGYWTMQDVRPGVTGYWQINGRSRTSYEERVRLDTAYATGWSLKLDLLILGKTAAALFDRGSAY